MIDWTKPVEWSVMCNWILKVTAVVTPWILGSLVLFLGTIMLISLIGDINHNQIAAMNPITFIANWIGDYFMRSE
jgi:hypothetical protein